MLNYLRSELYRNRRQPGIRIFLLLSLAALLLIFFSAAANSAARNNFIEVVFIAGVIGGMMVFPAVYSSLNRKEKGVHVQMISFGLKRLRIFAGDYLMSAFDCLVTAVLLVFCTLALSLFLPLDPGLEMKSVALGFLRLTGLLFLMVLPLVAMGQSFTYFFNNNGIAISSFFVLSFLIPNILSSFAQTEWVLSILRFMPAYHIMMLNFGGLSSLDVQWFCICLFSNLIVWLTAAAVIYMRKEI